MSISPSDPSKKTSINSLLNPQTVDASAAYSTPQHRANLPASVPPNQSQSHDPQPVQSVYSSFPPFNLRAANWDPADATKHRRLENTVSASQPYSQPSHANTPQPNTYTQPPPHHMPRPRADNSTAQNQIWSSQQQIPNMPYPAVPHAYPNERPAMPGDYRHYASGYPEPSNTDSTRNQSWPASERASPVRGALPQQRPSLPSYPSQESRYSTPPYYQPNQYYPAPYGQPPPPPSVQLPHQHASPPQAHPYQSPHPAPPQSGPQSQSQSPPVSQLPSQHVLQLAPHPPSQSEPQPSTSRLEATQDTAHLTPRTAEKRKQADPADGKPKSKRAKAKPKPKDGTANASKRSRKRNEAAQIAAQSAQLVPGISYASVPGDKEKDDSPNAPLQIVTVDGTQANSEASGPLFPELQYARCMSNRYRSEAFPRCVSCTRRWAGDSCRFQGIRFFLKDKTRTIVGISFVESQTADGPKMSFPTHWNTPLTAVHIRETKLSVARALLPILQQELVHLALPEIIRRPRECDVRATCDTCMTSIFSSSWMCRLCGREACKDCFELVKFLTVEDPASANGGQSIQDRRERHARFSPFFLTCTRRNEHYAKDFSPMSRFCITELEEAILNMQTILHLKHTLTGPNVALAHLQEQDVALSGTNGNASTAEIPDRESALTTLTTSPTSFIEFDLYKHCGRRRTGPQPWTRTTRTPGPFIPASGHAADIPYHLIRRFMHEEMTEDLFRTLWADGEPLMVTGVLEKFRLAWTPQYFIEKYGSQNCLIIECQTDDNKRITVGEFFQMFGKYEGRKECWKLKDWPPAADFKTEFPELYEDFSNAVPVPSYVRRDGVWNLASHFPSNAIGPDLGPKMYNAMASSQQEGSKGSTRLHMDMADAVNIMTYAESMPDGSPGCAAWDLFSATDSDKIREFMNKRVKTPNMTNVQDPIHSQQFYLNENHRRELAKEYGVYSYRIYQRPGDAIFIPAGCAHQVANLSDCVKIAIDFVSPENIDRCETLRKEFRAQNQSMVWKEDVLQLRTMMWFAWLSCCQLEKEGGAKSGSSQRAVSGIVNGSGSGSGSGTAR